MLGGKAIVPEIMTYAETENKLVGIESSTLQANMYELLLDSEKTKMHKRINILNPLGMQTLDNIGSLAFTHNTTMIELKVERQFIVV